MDPFDLQVALALLLVAGFVYAALTDWIRREVRDGIWQLLAGAGSLGGLVFLEWTGDATVLAIGLWILASGFVLQHLFPWDLALERRSPALPGYVEIAVYGATLAVVGGGAIWLGIGPGGVPVVVIAVVASVVLARALFEVGVLYGAADAKALMVAGLLVPMWTMTPVGLPANAQAAIEFFPFSLNLLLDAAVLSIVAPIALAIHNLRRGTFVFPRGFTSYRLPVSRLSTEFVWLKDPLLEGEDDADSTEADIAIRTRQQRELEERGVTEVWVTPQLPFVVFLLAGTIAALLFGNLLFDLAALA